MKTLNRILIVASLLFFACTSQMENDRKALLSAESELFQGNQEKMNVELAAAMVKKYSDFASLYPEDQQTPEYLFKAAELSMNMEMGSQAILYFETLKKQYPDFHKMPEVIFMTAFVYENQLNDLDRAKAGYTEFMEKYSDHVLYKDAEASIKNLGKSLDELIREFEAMNQSSDSLI
jgi:outer membrane protein assembly factor BamD (BamD/ComL family)